MRTSAGLALLILLSPATLRGSSIEDYRRARDRMEKDFALVPSFEETLKEGGGGKFLYFPRIIATYGSAIRQDPSSPFLSFALAEAHRLGGSGSEADPLYSQALKRANSPGEHLLLIELFEKRGLNEWAEKAEESLLELKLNMGISSLPLISAHYRQRGLELLRQGDRESARGALEFAKTLDPCRLENHVLLMRLSVRERNVNEAMEIVNAMRHCLKDFRNQGLVYSSLLLLLLLALPLALTAGVWGFLFKHIPSIEHRVFEFLPNRLPSTARAITAWSIIALPFLWGLPAFLLTVTLTALVWILFSRRERCLALSLLLIIMVSPFLLRAFKLLRSPEDPGGRFHLLSQVQTSGWDKESEERVVAMLEKVGEDFDLDFALGLLRKRRGNFAGAIEAYEAAIRLNPRSSVAYNNLGNVYFATRDYETAIEMYKRAVQLDSRSAVAHYNLAQVYQETLDFRESTEERRTASRLDFHLVRAASEASSDHFNRAVVDGTIPSAVLWPEVFSQLSLWEDWRGSPLRDLSLSASIIFLVLIFMSKYFKRGELGLRCSLCGRPVCVKCREKFEEEAVCPACDWRVSAAKSENLQVRLLKSIPRRSGILARVEAAILTILYPGTGHVFLGAVGRGLFFAILASLLISHLFLTELAHGRPLLISLRGQTLDRTLLLAVLGLTWVWSLMSVSRRKERPWPSKEA